MSAIIREVTIGDCRLIQGDCLEVMKELDPDYFDIACKRVEEAYAQPDLFVAPPEKPEQTGFDL